MKKLLIYLIIISGIITTSCQSKEKKSAQGAIDRYVIFVDSVNKAKPDKRVERWEFIQEEQLRKRNDAGAALKMFTGKDQSKQLERIKESDSKYQGVRVAVGNK
jgi:hypothetical protein